MMESLTELSGTLKESLLQDNENANVEQSERILSLASGSFLFIKGIGNLFSHPTLALGELIIGGMLVHRGVTGFCPVKQMVEGQGMQSPDAVFISTTEYITDAGSSSGMDSGSSSSGSMSSGSSSSGMGSGSMSSGSSSPGMGASGSSSAGSFSADMGSGSTSANSPGSSSGI